MKATIRRLLASNRTAAEAVAQTAGLFSSAMREANVVMFHPGRCGSTVVGMLLNQHPKIKWAGEIFARLKGKYGKKSWVWNDPYKMINLRTNIHMCNVFGIEIKKKHFSDVEMTKGGVVGFLSRIGYDNYIILKRENYLSQKVSSIVGRKMGAWNSSEKVSPPSVHVPIGRDDEDSIIDEFSSNDRFFSDIKSILDEESVLEILYERDIRSNPKEAFDKIVEYLGLERVGVEVETKKINDRPIRERISNFEQVRNCLRGTKYEWMVHQA